MGAWCSGELLDELESASFSESFNVKSLSLVLGDGIQSEKLDWESSVKSLETGVFTVKFPPL